MRKACNKAARSILYKFAFSSMHFSKWAREYYDNQRAKGKTHSVAVRALSNKWVKNIYKIWKDEIIYDENQKISSSARHSGCARLYLEKIIRELYFLLF